MQNRRGIILAQELCLGPPETDPREARKTLILDLEALGSSLTGSYRFDLGDLM